MYLFTTSNLYKFRVFYFTNDKKNNLFFDLKRHVIFYAFPQSSALSRAVKYIFT